MASKAFALDVDEDRWRILNELFDLSTSTELTTKINILSKSKEIQKRYDASFLVTEYFDLLEVKTRTAILKRLLQAPETGVRFSTLTAIDKVMSIGEPGIVELLPIIDKLRTDPDKETRQWANREADAIERQLKARKR